MRNKGIIANSIKKRRLPKNGQTLVLFTVDISFRIDGMHMVGPLREEKTRTKYTYEDVHGETYDGATVTIRPPTHEEIDWCEDELRRMIKDFEETTGYELPRLK